MLVLFDVDGTLLLTRGLGIECMRDAMHLHFGVEIDPSLAHFPGGLDPLIWRELCAAHELPDGEEHHVPFRRIYERLLAERLAAEPGRAYSLPGVPELLAALARVEGLTLGILSGNYPETGRLKLAAAGLDPDEFALSAWGTDGAARSELCAVAIERCNALRRRAVGPAEVVLIGDTPRDVECARGSGCRILAVATGRFSAAELRAAGADVAVESLAATGELVRWIRSPMNEGTASV